MAHTIVKFFQDDRGEKVKDSWHLVINKGGDNEKLCSGEFFGFGASGALFTTKEVDKGGITCENCKSFIREIKKINL